MSTEELLEKLLERLGTSAQATLPVSVDLWDTKHIAAYLKRSLFTVQTKIVVLPTFPRPIRLPVEGKSQALYKAREVVKWAEACVS